MSALEHGTLTAHSGGCRCEPCRAAKAAYWQAWRSRNPRRSVSAGYVLERVVADENGCWIWQGRKDRWGYGKDCLGLPAHRSAYRALVGDIPSGQQLDHLCRVRACCNPAHLEPVTPEENRRRALSAA